MTTELDTLEGTLTERLLAVLSESSLPVPTSDLIVLTAFGLSYARNRVWVELKKLERAGRVVKVVSRQACRSRGRARGVCVACKRPRVLSCREACNRCYQNPELRPEGPKVVHAVALWSIA